MSDEHEGITSIDDLAEHLGHGPIPLPDVEPKTGRTCEHCGGPQRGYAAINGAEVCHTGGPFPDCYELVTVHGEGLGTRDNTACNEVLERVWDLLEAWNALGRGDGIHGRQLRAALEGTDTTSVSEFEGEIP